MDQRATNGSSDWKEILEIAELRIHYKFIIYTL